MVNKGFIGGGVNNCLTTGSAYGAILGGVGNTASGYYGVILGGRNNTVTHAYAAVFGNGVNSVAACTLHSNNFAAQNMPTSAGVPGTFYIHTAGGINYVAIS